VGPCDLEVVFPPLWSEVRSSRVPAAGDPGRPRACDPGAGEGFGEVSLVPAGCSEDFSFSCGFGFPGRAGLWCGPAVLPLRFRFQSPRAEEPPIRAVAPILPGGPA
jgi:hypothetical protein